MLEVKRYWIQLHVNSTPATDQLVVPVRVTFNCLALRPDA